ncbi:sugar ABC transporter permease [Jiangella asiatica]|uniref:Sugar ABC transporter permease n=1 Tax=Jiangella asiatica TaxID=2530372 RepID=A0A4R5D3Q6_9ACTN|nr:sugar ABC transporter permease [Jiangella asiatica]
MSDVGTTTLISAWELVGLENFGAVLNDAAFWNAAKVTALLTAVLLVVDLIIGFVAALALTGRGRLIGATLSLLVFVWTLPPLVSGSVWKFLLSGDGGVNAALGMVGLGPVDWLSSPSVALWSVSLVAAWASLPFAILIIRGGLMSIPPDVLEAAALDGANAWQRATRVILPLLRPTLAVLTILLILYAFGSFNFVYVLTGGGPGDTTNILPFLAYQTAFRTYSFDLASAIAVLSMVVVLVLSVPYVLGVRKEQAA